MSDIILDILRRYVDGTKIKKASARSGGEYHSPCPKCGGTDRFCVFPEQPGGALAMQHHRDVGLSPALPRRRRRHRSADVGWRADVQGGVRGVAD